MTDLNEVSAFISIVRYGGLSRAAEATGLPKSTLSRKLQLLEKRLGVTLLQRTTRKIILTRAGEEYYKQCSQLLNQLSEVEKMVASEQQTPKGLLRFTAPVETGASLAPLIKEFHQQYPEVSLDIDFSNRIIDLMGEGFDVALRAGYLKDSSLKARKVAREKFILVASPKYLKTAPPLTKPGDLSNHQLIGFSTKRENIVWKLTSEKGRTAVQLKETYRTNSLGSCLSFALEGLGVTLVPQFHTQTELTKGELIQVLPQWHQDGGEFSLVYPNQNYLPPKTRVFIDFFSNKLKSVFS